MAGGEKSKSLAKSDVYLQVRVVSFPHPILLHKCSVGELGVGTRLLQGCIQDFFSGGGGGGLLRLI